MSYFDLLLLSLAVARITRCLIYEYGPLDILGRLRFICNADLPTPKPGSLAELFNCPWCMSFWVAVAVFASYAWWPDYTIPACLPLALSFLAGSVLKLTT